MAIVVEDRKYLEEPVCGSCCHFLNEDTYGYGFCPFIDLSMCEKHCSDVCSCGSFASDGFKRHQMAVLRQCQRCLGRNIGTEHDLDVKAIGEAIDFIVDYCKLH